MTLPRPKIAILGGGPGGYEAALVAAQLGAEVTVIDEDGLGGACVLTDCVPSKTLIESSSTMTSLSRAARTIVAENLRPRRYSLWRAAERITVPALVTFGSRDRLVNPRLAAPARRAFRDATVMVLPRTGHVAQMERPELVARLLREMVDRTRAGGDAAGNSGRHDPVDA